MAIKALEWAWEQDIPRSERDVLMVLANAINKDDEFAYPSQEVIARKVRMSERHVRRLIQALEGRGLVRTMPGHGKGRGRAPTRYFLACDHRTGEERNLTTGHEGPPVGSQPDLTGMPSCPPVTSQPDKGCPVHIKEPEVARAKPEKKEPKTIKAPRPSAKIGPDGLPMDGRVAFEEWVAAAKRSGWKVPRGTAAAQSDQRKTVIRARLREFGMTGWREQIALAESQPFLGGDNSDGWSMGLDWFLKRANWQKVGEQCYLRNGRKKPALPESVTPEEWRRRLANYEHDGSWSSSYGPRPGQEGYAGPPLRRSSNEHGSVAA